MGLKIDLTGQKFGMLTVIKKEPKYISPKKATKNRWLCICECGKRTIVTAGNLSYTKSCGCLVGEKHGLRGHNLYPVWVSMKDRCKNPKHKYYKYYGDRGITVCDKWRNNFMPFYNWAIANGWRKGLQIDRTDNNGNYEPDNCRFVTARENILNKNLLMSNNTSGYCGVRRFHEKWRAGIRIRGKQIELGTYDTIKEAAIARNNYITKHNIQHEYKIQEV